MMHNSYKATVGATGAEYAANLVERELAAQKAAASFEASPANLETALDQLIKLSITAHDIADRLAANANRLVGERPAQLAEANSAACAAGTPSIMKPLFRRLCDTVAELDRALDRVREETTRHEVL